MEEVFNLLLFTCKEQLHDSTISLRGSVWVSTIRLIPPLSKIRSIGPIFSEQIIKIRNVNDKKMDRQTDNK